MVAVKKMELVSSGGKGERMQFDSSSSKNHPRCKGFERLDSNKK
jgi:hypothetical protein